MSGRLDVTTESEDNMTELEVMAKIVKIAAKWRDEGRSGQEFVATTMFAVASVCAASDFPRDKVETLTTEAIKSGYKKPFKELTEYEN